MPLAPHKTGPLHSPRRRNARRGPLAAAALAAWGLLGAMPAWAQAAQAASSAGIFTCVDAQGRRMTSDRPIAECSAREQRVLNRDGSVQRVVPPSLTPEERAEREAADRRAVLDRAGQADAVRRDRNLVSRFANEAAHRKSREAALDTVRLAIKASEVRMKELATERKPLADEAEFFKGRQMPARLKQALDSNDAAVEAQRGAAANQEFELVRINKLHDVELARLRRLWAGAAPGSLGPAPALPATAGTSAAPVAAAARAMVPNPAPSTVPNTAP